MVEEEEGFDPLASFAPQKKDIEFGLPLLRRERERERDNKSTLVVVDDDDASSDDRARLHISAFLLWSFFGDDRNL